MGTIKPALIEATPDTTDEQEGLTLTINSYFSSLELGGGFNVGVGTFSNFGTDEQGFGLTGVLNYQDKNISASFGGSGAWFNKEFGTGGSGFGGSLFAGGAYKYYDDESIGYSTTKYFTGDRHGSQRIGTLTYSSNGTTLTYSNDHFKRFGDANDRFRTASLTVSNSGYTVGTNLFTEEIDKEYRDDYRKRNLGNYYPLPNKNLNQPRAGVLFFEYENQRIGLNSDTIRDVIQNKVAHGIIMNGFARLKGKKELPVGYFTPVDYGWNLYYQNRIGMVGNNGY